MARPKGTMSNLDEFAKLHSSVAIEGTIGSKAYLQGDRLMLVRGYGLVVGLSGRGSRNCMPSVREYLVREIRRNRLANPQTEYHMTPEELVDSPDTAVVEVTGEIPAGAAKGRTFDVFVSAASFDPDTQSLAGGYLLTCELKVISENSPQSIIEGRTLAKARGPIFMNPFVREGKNASGSNLREGRVLAGGVTIENRELSLVTAIESYSTVRQIQNAINACFNYKPPLADAITPTTVKFRIPPQYYGRERRFMEILMHLSLVSTAAAKETRGRQLAGELVRLGAPLDDVALSLEGIGPTAVGLVKDYYTHNRREVSYYAARTGLRLGDGLALEVIIRCAQDEKSPFRAQAIRDLGDCGNSQAIVDSGNRGIPLRAAAVLRELLVVSDPRIRILAYEALRRVDPDSIETRMVGHEPENFVLDVVPSEGPMLIYARRTGTRRIALVGGDRLVLQPPFLYAEPGKPILISAGQNDKYMSVAKKDQKGRTILGPIKLAPVLPQFVHFMGNDPENDAFGKLQGLGLDYAVVLDVVFRLCERGAVAADFRWEEPGLEDLIGPLKPTGRPESEL